MREARAMDTFEGRRAAGKIIEGMRKEGISPGLVLAPADIEWVADAGREGAQAARKRNDRRAFEEHLARSADPDNAAHALVQFLRSHADTMERDEGRAATPRHERQLRSGSSAARASPVRTAERGRERAPRGRSDERHRRRRQCPGHRTTERALHPAARHPAEVVGDEVRRRRYVVCFNPREAERQRKHRAQTLTELGAELSSLRACSRVEHSKRMCELRASGRYGR